jgi:hypothetical protein
MSYKLRSYQYWCDYLEGGRKKYIRPLYEYGMTIEKASKFQLPGGDLHIKANWAGNYPFIIVHSDDSFTLQGGVINSYWGGSWNILKSQGVRYRIWKYTGVNVFQRNYEIKVIDENAGLTPSKIQGCRQCKQTGKQDGWCSPTTCFDGDFYDTPNGDSVYACPEHPDAQSPHGSWHRFHLIACTHGQMKGHTLPRSQECYYCKGSGKRDYGNKPISLLWDGSPLRVKDKKIVKKPLTELERILANHVQSSSV